MFNGFGFRQNSAEHMCYATFQEVVAEVDNWFDKHLKNHTLAESLCGYNAGFQSEKYYKCLKLDSEAYYLRNFIAFAKM